MNFKCKNCEKELLPLFFDELSIKYCDVKCRFASYKKNTVAKRKEKSDKTELKLQSNPKICPFCETSFVRNHTNRIYCSKECMEKRKIRQINENWINRSLNPRNKKLKS